MHPLDNIIWNALTTRQTEFAESFGQARRFMPDVTALGAFHEPTPEGYESLAGLLDTRGTVALFLHEPYQNRAGWERVAGAPLLPMVCRNGPPPFPSHPTAHPDPVPLGDPTPPDIIR